MKVYELMKMLESCQAGADVKFSTVLKQSEIDSFGAIGNDGEEDIYNLVGDIKDVDNDSKTVFLQS